MAEKYTFSAEAPICPYCDRAQIHDGGYFYNEDLTETECGHCDKVFSVEVYTSTNWTCTTIEEPTP